MKCTCGGETEPGFIPDFGMHAVWTAIWLPGLPSLDKGLWETVRTGAGITTAESEAKMIEARRCTTCGLLQLFATQPPPRGTSPG